MGSYHAALSPSGSSRWTLCTAAPGAEAGKPNTTSDASRPGTCGHQIGEELLNAFVAGATIDPQTYLGRVMGFHANGEDWADKFSEGVVFQHTVTVEQDLLDAVVTYVNYVKQRVETTGGQLLVEQRVPIGWITGEQGATGSADAIILCPDGTIEVIDAKFGRGKVYAYETLPNDDLMGDDAVPRKRMNTQLAMYALGAWHEHSAFIEIKRVRATIVQPFLNSVSEYDCSIEELLGLGRWLSEKAEETRSNPTFVVSGKGCHFCKARFDCHARNATVLAEALEGFDDVETLVAAKPKALFRPKLGHLFSKIEMIRAWCDDIETATLAALTAGEKVSDPSGKPMKLVEGRKPHKSWSDEAAATEILERCRLGDAMWKKKLISPTDAQKMAATKRKKRGEAEPAEKAPIGPKMWEMLSELVTQGEGKPTPAFATDPRPALPSTAGFTDAAPPADNSDLF